MKTVSGDTGAELGLAHWLLEEAGMPATNSDRMVVGDCIRLLAKQGGTVQTAAEFILRAAQMAILEGEVLTVFWFKDRKYIPRVPQGPRVGRSRTPEEVQASKDTVEAVERQAYEMWKGMSEKFRQEHPWKGTEFEGVRG